MKYEIKVDIKKTINISIECEANVSERDLENLIKMYLTVPASERNNVFSALIGMLISYSVGFEPEKRKEVTDWLLNIKEEVINK